MTRYKYTKKESLQIHNNGLIVGELWKLWKKNITQKKIILKM